MPLLGLVGVAVARRWVGGVGRPAPRGGHRGPKLRWLQLVYNLPGLVGVVHRVVAWRASTWKEPNGAFRAALKAVRWSVRRNLACIRAAAWPELAPEVGYPGEVVLQPVDSFPMEGALFTDGSIGASGGAAAVLLEEEAVYTSSVPEPRSSTHCELVALNLAVQHSPPQILTDSLAALLMLKNWGRWSSRRTLNCPDRVEVRQLLHAAGALEVTPRCWER